MKLIRTVEIYNEKTERDYTIQFVQENGRTSEYIYTPLPENEDFYFCIKYKYEVLNVFDDPDYYKEEMAEAKEDIEDFNYDYVPDDYDRNGYYSYETLQNIIPAWLIN